MDWFHFSTPSYDVEGFVHRMFENLGGSPYHLDASLGCPLWDYDEEVECEPDTVLEQCSLDTEME